MSKIIVLDFGGQYAHLIVNRIRRLGVYSEIKPHDTPANELKDAKGIILSGGPQNISEDDSLRCSPDIFNLDIPILGICYGYQLISFMLGGEVCRGITKEYGRARLKIINKIGLFDGLNDEEIVWMSHGDYVSKLPDNFEIYGSTQDCKTAAAGCQKRKIYGLQFHPEVTHTKNGMNILLNFVYKICKCEQNWDMQTFIENQIKKIKTAVNDKKVFLLISGGVDSTVCFALLNKALGPDNVYGLHIDNGFMRKDESNEVKQNFIKNNYKNFHVHDASDIFLDAVKGIYNPEEKRKIIGEKFIEVQDKQLKNLNFNPNDWILGQGTIYPDTIETGGTKNAELIKTHHNRVEAVQKLIEQGKVIEPLKDLYKDEVRKVGEMLGLPYNLIYRHPFPGPGLAVRCLCIENLYKYKKEDENRCNEIANKYLLKANILPIKSVGVQGDSRTYAHPVILSGESDWKTLEKVSIEITNNISNINRAIFSLTPINLQNMTLKKDFITKKRLELLRDADDLATKFLHQKNLYESIWQMPVVLIPISFNNGESIVLRPINSTEAMTAEISKIPMKYIYELAKKIMDIHGIDSVFYDITNKPPGTIEWE